VKHSQTNDWDTRAVTHSLAARMSQTNDWDTRAVTHSLAARMSQTNDWDTRAVTHSQTNDWDTRAVTHSLGTPERSLTRSPLGWARVDLVLPAAARRQARRQAAPLRRRRSRRVCGGGPVRRVLRLGGRDGGGCRLPCRLHCTGCAPAGIGGVVSAAPVGPVSQSSLSRFGGVCQVVAVDVPLDEARYGEIWRDMGRSGEATLWGDMARHGEIWGDMARRIWRGDALHGEIWGDMARYGDIWRDMGRYGDIDDATLGHQ